MPLLLTLHKPLARIWEIHIDCIATCARPWPWLQRQWRSQDSVPTGSIRAAIVATLTWKLRNCVHYFYISASYCQRGTFGPPSSYSTVCHILCNMLLWVKDHNESLCVWVIRAHFETEISSNFLCGWFDGFWRRRCQCAEKLLLLLFLKYAGKLQMCTTGTIRYLTVYKGTIRSALLTPTDAPGWDCDSADVSERLMRCKRFTDGSGGGAGAAPLLYTLAVMPRIPCPSPGDQRRIW